MRRRFRDEFLADDNLVAAIARASRKNSRYWLFLHQPDDAEAESLGIPKSRQVSLLDTRPRHARLDRL
jgi:hypothetical protein